MECYAAILPELGFVFCPEDGGGDVPESALRDYLKTGMKCISLPL
jgi:hypothetical protein